MVRSTLLRRGSFYRARTLASALVSWAASTQSERKRKKIHFPFFPPHFPFSRFFFGSEPRRRRVGQVIIKNLVIDDQGRIGYAGTHVPMSVPRLGLIKPGQTYVCPKLWAFSMKITLWLILHFFENRRLVCPNLRAFSELFVSSRCQ